MGLTVKVAWVELVVTVKSFLIVVEMNVPGAVGYVTSTDKLPHNYYAAEPETLSYHSATDEEAETNIEVVIEGKAVP